MIIYFMQKWPDGLPSYFKEKIINGIIQNGGLVTSALSYDKMIEISAQTPKIHTLRKSFRIKQGMMLDLAYWSGKPYNSSPDRFITQVPCTGTQIVDIQWADKECKVYIDGRLIGDSKLARLALNDGFSGTEAFLKHFNKTCTYNLIHWTGTWY